MSKSIEINAEGVRVVIFGDPSPESVAATARRYYQTGGERLRDDPQDGVGLRLLRAADALTVHLYGKAASEALEAGVDGVDILDFHAWAESLTLEERPDSTERHRRWRVVADEGGPAREDAQAEADTVADISVHAGRRPAWRATPEQEAELDELLADLEKEGD